MYKTYISSCNKTLDKYKLRQQKGTWPNVIMQVKDASRLNYSKLAINLHELMVISRLINIKSISGLTSDNGNSSSIYLSIYQQKHY